MHIQPDLALARCDRALRERVLPGIHSTLAEVTVLAWRVDGDGEPVPAAHALGLRPLPGRRPPDYQPIAPGDPWGRAWETTWLRLDGVVPATQPSEIVELYCDLGWADHSVGGQCEGLVYRPDGSIVKALHPRNGWVRLVGPGATPGVLSPDGRFTMYVEAAANPLVLGVPPFVVTELGERDSHNAGEPYRLSRADICVFNSDLWEFARDLEVVAGLAREVSRQEPRFWRLIAALDAALDTYDVQDVAGTVGLARQALAGVLAQPATASAHQLTAVGNSHIDSAWLWPLRETIRKLARTVSNALGLMDSDPVFIYAMSSAQQFAWLEEYYPELFARVAERVADGRIIPVGGMWVEPDTILVGGESLVRQFTMGRRYFAEKFGIEQDIVWLPDTFGYSGALPQLAKRAGFRWFLTQKLSWNDTNRFPHHTFQWEGIDGTRILTHFPPVDTYAAEVTAAELHHAVANFRDKAIASHSLLLYGYGDGGGGPTREMLGRTRRFGDLEGAPVVRPGTPSEFFADAERELIQAERIRPGATGVWVGELYLELHRGTLTSQLSMKQGNRRSEALLRIAEYLATVAAVRGVAAYPDTQLTDIWRTVLLHQFHDILPGSSIAWVHREASETYRRVATQLEELIADSCAALGGTGVAGRLLPVAWHGQPAWAMPGKQTRRDYPPVTVTTGQAGEHILDNSLLRVVVNGDGHVASLLDLRSDREVVPAGQCLGVLEICQDEPTTWDAWDIDRDTRRTRRPVMTVDAMSVESRPEEGATVTVTRSVGSSTIRQTITLAPGARHLDWYCEVDWRQRERMLTVALPVAVRATTARYETQFGYIERPCHQNTSWDEARFEVSAHRYVHIEEPGYAVGIVNDSSHGCSVTRASAFAQGDAGRMVRLSLLRSPRFPDPDTDQGVHQMRWAVVCADTFASTVAEGYAINSPVIANLPAVDPLVWLDDVEGLPIIDTVKMADDGSGDIVLRLYEAAGGGARACLRWSDDLGSEVTVTETDLNERLPSVHSSTPAVVLGPFQVMTLRLHRNRNRN